MNFLNGYKTYIIATVLLLLAVLSFLGVVIPGVNTDPGTMIIMALGLLTGRSATASVAKAVNSQ